ncbi:SRPBCC family protein [Micromonospora sp. CPCC 205561]|uniref:SRPBCC family protein n=1 Tax=Micromonospora sp. CPCC 205561 TaxID=3122407 RepID=UPI002FF0BE23
MTSNGTRWALLGATTVAVAGVGRAVARRRRRRQPERRDGWYVVRRGVTIDRPVEAVIGFWTDRERMDRALAEWATLEQLDDERWRCVARDAAGGGTEWRAEITVEGPGQLRWRVVDGPEQEGTVRLTPAPQDRGTEVRAELRWRSGPLRRAFGLVGGDDPDLGLRDALRRVKALVECGQVIDTRRDPSARGPAQEKATDKMREKLTTGGRA